MKLGFRKCMNDQCPYIKKDEVGVIVVCLHIDDTLCVGDLSFSYKGRR